MRKAIVVYNLRTNGLGNRIRVSLGARKLAEATDRHLFVVWPTGKAFRPRFSDLWEGRLGTPFPRVASKLLARAFPYRKKDLRAIREDDAAAVWQIQTGSVLEVPEGVGDWEDDLRALVPIPAIADEVRQHHAAFGGEPYIGVQVRSHATSHGITRQSSPVEWFRDRLDAVRAAAPGVRFFLSCDRPDVQREFLARYPGSVAIDDKGGYNSVRGVQSAVADSYLLAGSGHIIGPHYSSFVELAVKLAHHRVGLDTSLNPLEVDVAALTTVTDPLRPAVRTG